MKERIMKMKEVLLGTSIVLATSVTSFAAEGTGISAVEGIIQSTSTELLASSSGVIKAGVGVGVVFFAAKLLWTKFKSMAK